MPNTLPMTPSMKQLLSDLPASYYTVLQYKSACMAAMQSDRELAYAVNACMGEAIKPGMFALQCHCSSVSIRQMQ